MASSCKTCGAPSDMGKSCRACGYDPMSHRDEQVVARVGVQGDGAFRGDRNRLWIVTTERVVFLRNGARSNEAKLGGIREATYARRRNPAVLALLLGIAFVAALSLLRQAGPVGLAMAPLGMTPFFLAWALWREPSVAVLKNDGTSFVERAAPGQAISAEKFVQVLQDQLKLRRS